MPNLKELYFNHYVWISNFEPSAKNLDNVERVYFESTEANYIMLLLRYASKVKEIMVRYLESSTAENEVIDLVAWNKERKQLIGASKVTIYVDERIFLLTKFAKANIELSLVTLKRFKA